MKKSFNADPAAVTAYRRRLNTSAFLGLGFSLYYGLQYPLEKLNRPHHDNQSWWLLLAIGIGLAYTVEVIRSIVSVNARTIELIEFADDEIRIFTIDTRLFGGLYKKDGSGGVLHKGSVYIQQHSLETSYNGNEEEKATTYLLSENGNIYALVDHLFSEFPQIRELLKSYAQNSVYPSINPVIAHRRRQQLLFNFVLVGLVVAYSLIPNRPDPYINHKMAVNIPWRGIDSAWLSRVPDSTYIRITDRHVLNDLTVDLLQSARVMQDSQMPKPIYYLDIFSKGNKYRYDILDSSSQYGAGTYLWRGRPYRNYLLWETISSIAGH